MELRVTMASPGFSAHRADVAPVPLALKLGLWVPSPVVIQCQFFIMFKLLSNSGSLCGKPRLAGSDLKM